MDEEERRRRRRRKPNNERSHHVRLHAATTINISDSLILFDSTLLVFPAWRSLCAAQMKADDVWPEQNLKNKKGCRRRRCRGQTTNKNAVLTLPIIVRTEEWVRNHEEL